MSVGHLKRGRITNSDCHFAKDAICKAIICEDLLYFFRMSQLEIQQSKRPLEAQSGVLSLFLLAQSILENAINSGQSVVELETTHDSDLLDEKSSYSPAISVVTDFEF